MILKSTATSRFHAGIFAAESTPTSASTTNGAIQLQTVFGITIGLVGFIVLILAFSSIYRRCFPSASTSRGSQQRTRLGHVSRRRPHVDCPVVVVSFRVPFEPVNEAPPPYEALRLPPYTEQSSSHTEESSSHAEESLTHAQQSSELSSPPMARLGT
ncbi:hypothetical protein BDN67DRAFT_1071212 [Paxillus ammoniavirescens]|nr:hypothetical protein BDN67DRAFT_1071212 [Paxillus ammoniavirescens]